MRIRALLIACLVAASSLIALPANASGAIQFRKIQYDTPGGDLPAANTKLNAEYVTIKNTGSTTRTLTGWTVRDPAHHVYTFPNFKLGPGESVRLHTGKGTNTAHHVYWGKGYYVGTTPATKQSCAAAAAR
jgi:Lamin Tail Domain